jgi:23S rRNA pseudouridine1911/1915/1917 synthase
MQIIYEDNHLLIVNKPAGLLVQGDKTGDPTLTDWGKDYLKDKYSKPGAVFLNPTHRIDRPVSGAVLMARTDKALSRLTIMFQQRTIKKTYLAIVTKEPSSAQGTLRHWLIKDEQRNRANLYDTPRGAAKECILEYEVFKKTSTNICLKINPLTGRPHQIRAQLAAIGCPIIGDLKYGAAYPLADASIGLHSWMLEFEHPVQKIPVVVQAPPPNLDIWR